MLFRSVHVPQVLIERVERRCDAPVLLEFQQVGVHRASQLRRLRLRGGFVLAFPQRQQQCLDTVLLLHVEHPVVRVERVERDGLLLRIGEVDAVLSDKDEVISPRFFFVYFLITLDYKILY